MPTGYTHFGGGSTRLAAEILAGYYWLGSLCKGLVAHAWLGLKFFWTFTRLVGKACNLCRVKTDISAVLTVKSGLDPHMIIEFEDDYESMFLFMVTYDISYIYFVG